MTPLINIKIQIKFILKLILSKLVIQFINCKVIIRLALNIET